MTRLLADYVKIRLHVKGVHVHHCVWGIVAAFVAIGALYWNQIYVGVFAAGIGVALIASEAKELVLQKWGR